MWCEVCCWKPFLFMRFPYARGVCSPHPSSKPSCSALLCSAPPCVVVLHRKCGVLQQAFPSAATV